MTSIIENSPETTSASSSLANAKAHTSATDDQHAVGTAVFEIKALADLSPHPENVELYGERESIDDLLKSISTVGQLDPIIITADGRIISGHRRHRALVKLERTEAIVRVIELTDETEILAALLEYNRHRIKSGSQLAKEAQLEMRIERERAAVRKAASGSSDTGAKLPPSEKGKSRQKVAKKLGVSERTVDKMVQAASAADKAAASGDADTADAIRSALDKGADTGLNVAVALGAHRPTTAKRKKPATPAEVLPENPVATDTTPPPEHSEVSAPSPQTQPSSSPEEPSARTKATSVSTAMEADFVDFEKTLTGADEIVTFLRLLKSSDLSNQQKRDLGKVFDQIQKLRVQAGI